MRDSLFLCHRLPYPPNKGDKIRSHALLCHLAKRGPVHLACFVDDAADLEYLDAVRKLAGGECYFEPLGKGAKSWRSLVGLATGKPLTTACFGSRQLQAWTGRILRERAISDLVVFGSAMAPYLLQAPVAQGRVLFDLASQVTSLQSVLSNKQLRGVFGQGRMEAIVQDKLPKGSYEFQYTLKNGKRPDCVVMLPDGRPLVIDAKFPLEAVTAFRDGKSEDERKFAGQRVRHDVMKHINDIAERYLCPGETQDVALMFVPSESVYAELHDSFDDIVQKAYRAQVMMVSPTLLMLAIQVVQQIQKDAQMREATDLIRTEVGHMMKDVRLLGERAKKLQTHFGQANDDIGNILTSANRIEKRASKIEELEFDGDDASAGSAIAGTVRKIQAAE